MRLSIPITFSAILEAVVDNVVLAIVSRYLGTDAVAAYAVVDVIVEVTNEFTMGIIDAESTLCSQAYGAGNNFLAGQYVQICSILYLLVQVPIVFVWSFFMYDIMIWLGFDHMTALMGQDFARVKVFADIMDGLAEAYHNLLEVVEREMWSASVDVAQVLVELGVKSVGIIVFGARLTHIALIDIMVATVFIVFTVSYTVYMGWMSPFLKGMFQSFALIVSICTNCALEYCNRATKLVPFHTSHSLLSLDSSNDDNIIEHCFFCILKQRCCTESRCFFPSAQCCYTTSIWFHLILRRSEFHL